MSNAVTSVASSAPSVSAPPAEATAPAATTQGFSFHELLSELNPLQYVPVLGTIYRSVTGDTIPQAALTAGSLVFSGLTGGPVGLAIGAATIGLEQATGINPETIEHNLLARMGIGQAEPAVAPPVQTAATSAASASPAAPAPTPMPALGTAAAPAAAALPVQRGWTAEQLSAYGITSSADGTLEQGNLTGSDVLNQLVLTSLAGGVMEAGAAALPAASA